jgi:hypothetical protein
MIIACKDSGSTTRMSVLMIVAALCTVMIIMLPLLIPALLGVSV